MRRAWSLGCLIATVAITVIACTTDYQKGLDDVNYGGPNVLASQVPPGPSIDEVASAQTSSGGGTDSANQPKCVQKGGTLVGGAGGEGGAAPACTVSFAKDVLPALLKGGCSATSCHGGAAPTQQPMVDSANIAGTYTAMSKFTISNGKLYINPCSTDPTMSAIAANVDAKAAAADRGTLMPQGAIGVPDAVPIVTTWLSCGSPNN